jgi:uncharacterized protein YbjT (DUF2867 family)
MYTIIGVTGHVGSVAAKELLKAGHPLRVVLRNPAKAEQWEKMGAEIAIADLNDEDNLADALKGAEGVFVMTPPMFDSADPIGDHLKMLKNIFSAVQRSGVQYVVYLSSIGGHLSSGTGAILKLYDMEQKLQQLSIPTAGIRAGWFMENFEGSFNTVLSEGKLYSFIDSEELKLPMVAAKDIGKLAAALLQDKKKGHRIVEFSGPKLYSVLDVANSIGAQIGKKIELCIIPSEDYDKTYRSFGFTEGAAKLMAEMNIGFNSGHICFEGKGDILELHGITTLEKFVNEKII